MALNSKHLSDLFFYVKRQFGDESTVQLLEADIIRWANQGVMEIVSKNKVLRASATTPTVANVATYQTPDDALQIQAVKYNAMVLSPIGFDRYQLLYSATAISDPQPTDSPTYWTQYGSAILIASPPTVDGDILTIYYVPEPAVMTTDGSSIPIPDRYFDRLCEYVMAKAYEMDEDWNAHQVQRGMFEKNLLELNHEETNMTGPYPTIQDVWSAYT